MDILIACRSIATSHPVTINTEVRINRVHYDADFDFAPLKDFYDMVWCKGCPVYTPFAPRADERTLGLTQHVFNEAHSVLKVGGIFVMPLNPELIKLSSLEHIMSKAQASIVAPSEGSWSMELTKIEDMPVRVEPTYEYALVFTKTKAMVGGRRRARKTMRRRYRR
jgi:hypothetical protein